MKKLLAVLLVALFAISLVACGAKTPEEPAATTAPAADSGDAGTTPVATDDDVTVDYLGGSDKDNTYGEQGFFGPYTEMNAAVLEPGTGLVFDTSITDAWITTEVAPQEMPAKQYAVIKIKTDDPEGINGFTITFGGQGHLWEQWTTADGSAAPALTTEWQTVTIDLAAAGADQVVCDGPDFAMNKGEAAQGKIYVESITFTNTAA
jgi:predicted small lipoprotein YifL